MIQFPATPPPEVLDMLDTAACLLGTLRSRRLDLRLCVRNTADRETLDAEVWDEAGLLMRRLTSRELLELLAGTTTDA